MFRHNEQIYDRQRFPIVVHQQHVRIVVCDEALAFCPVRTVGNLGTKLTLLALELEFLTT